METAYKAAAAGVCAALLGLVVKKHNPELALALGLAGATAVLASALGLIGKVSEVLTLAFHMSGMSGALLAPIIKCVGIGVVSRLGADVCRDGGSAALASSVELCGAAAALLTALPLIKTLLTMLKELA